jgi:alpha-beta hydrolase superfamily lysophospholipase
MFDDGAASYDTDYLAGGGRRPGHVPTAFPLKQVTCPVVLFNGSADTLPDPAYTRRHLSHCIVDEIVVDGYEHLDFLMAADVDQQVFPLIQACLSKLRPGDGGVHGEVHRSRGSSELSVRSGLHSH